jgi:tetratricopeptide (TPR) repeat protein
MGKWILIAAACSQIHAAETFNKDVAPIVFKRCVSCHHAGESTLFSLVRYEDVKKHAAQIVAATKSRYMPPWLPEPGPLRFTDERRLSPGEIATLERWVSDGMKEGNKADAPAVPRLAAGWQLAQPDLVLTAPKAFQIPATGADVYRNFILPIPFTGTRYIRAVEIRPGNHGVVHHANLLVDRARSLRWRDGTDGQPGFPGMDVEIPAGLTDPESHFLFWKHGAVTTPEPKAMAWTLTGGSDLILNVHVKPTGKQEQIQPSVGLYFTKDAPQFLPILVQLENDRALNIPAGARDFVVSDEFALPLDADLLGVYPHAHYLGHDLQATAIFPDGSEQSLIHIPRWDVNWQGVYRYAKPVLLPKGTRIRMRWSYDNSTGRRVTAGDQATDEMAHLWLQLLPRGEGDQRIVIQEAVARKRLLRDPDDFGAHFNLGGILRVENDPAGAIRELREAVRIRPRDEVALNTLGALVQFQNQPEEAEELYRRALISRPGYAAAHYNLAGLLVSQGKIDQGILQLREVLRIDPEDANAHANLGVALARKGDYAAAKESLERSLLLNPDNPGARKNLERVELHLR